MANASTFANGEVQVFAYCANTGQAVAASSARRTRGAAIAQEMELVAKLAQRVREQRVSA